MTDHVESADYEFPHTVRPAAKKGWNIWRIKNRWLRAAVAWPFAIGCAAVMAALALVLIVVFAVKGVWDGLADVFDAKERADWAQVFHAAWAALTGRDEPA
jgi:hypothetical protein